MRDFPVRVLGCGPLGARHEYEVAAGCVQLSNQPHMPLVKHLIMTLHPLRMPLCLEIQTQVLFETEKILPSAELLYPLWDKALYGVHFFFDAYGQS